MVASTSYRFVRETSEGGTSSLVEIESKKKKPSSEQVMGEFSKIEIGEKEYTVQTEDLGLDKAEIVTCIFFAGQVVKKVEYSYQKHVDHPSLSELLPKAIRMNHEATIRSFRKEMGDPNITPPPVIQVVEPVEMKQAAWDLLLQRLEEEKQPKKRRVSWDEIVRARRKETEAERDGRHD